jgi:hypothetical protein
MDLHLRIARVPVRVFGIEPVAGQPLGKTPPCRRQVVPGLAPQACPGQRCDLLNKAFHLVQVSLGREFHQGS